VTASCLSLFLPGSASVHCAVGPRFRCRKTPATFTDARSSARVASGGGLRSRWSTSPFPAARVRYARRTRRRLWTAAPFWPCRAGHSAGWHPATWGLGHAGDVPVAACSVILSRLRHPSPESSRGRHFVWRRPGFAFVAEVQAGGPSVPANMAGILPATKNGSPTGYV